MDVFAEEKYAGNQLAVFTEAAALSSADMQRLAKEMHFSESTFLLSREPRDGGYNARIFTPEAEVPFTGAPTLVMAFVIQQETLPRRVCVRESAAIVDSQLYWPLSIAWKKLAICVEFSTAKC